MRFAHSTTRQKNGEFMIRHIVLFRVSEGIPKERLTKTSFAIPPP